MRLEHRLRRLEAVVHATAATRACVECGAVPGEHQRFVLAPVHLDRRPPVPGPDACPRCRRRPVVRLGAITLDGPGEAP